MQVITRIHGIEEVSALLRKLPRDIEGEALNSALQAGAREIVKEAKARAPVRSDARAIALSKKSTKGRLAGFLRASISVRSVGSRKVPRVVVTVGKAFYGMFQEFGTRTQPARPWLRPAFDSAAPAALKKIIASLGKSIERAVNKRARRRR